MERTIYTVERVEYFFWPVAAGDPSEMFKAGELEVQFSEACDSKKAFFQLFFERNVELIAETFIDSWLRPALLRVGAVKFIPAKRPSFVYRPADKVLEWCAYHDTHVHHTIYESSGIEGIIMAPCPPLEFELDELCQTYGVSWYSGRLYAVPPSYDGDDGTDGDENGGDDSGNAKK